MNLVIVYVVQQEIDANIICNPHIFLPPRQSELFLNFIGQEKGKLYQGDV